MVNVSLQPQHVASGLKHLRAADPILGRVIDQVGPFQLRLDRNRFQSLVRSIISQQISGSAARSIRRRLQRMVAPGAISAAKVAALTPEQFRGAGLSPQKSRYLLDLSRKVLAGQVRLKRLARMPDEEVVQELTQVTGIGVWTAQMFLIFSLGRMDVFPHDDLGIRSALRNLYRLKSLPDKAASHRIAQPWRPFATMASWYCWRSLDLVRNGESE